MYVGKGLLFWSVIIHITYCSFPGVFICVLLICDLIDGMKWNFS